MFFIFYCIDMVVRNLGSPCVGERNGKNTYVKYILYFKAYVQLYISKGSPNFTATTIFLARFINYGYNPE